MTQIVDRAAWPRRELFEFFSPMSQPFYSVTFKQDVTRLYAFTKEHHLSFYHSLVYALMREGLSDYHCRSDAYLLEDLRREWRETPGFVKK